MPRRDVSRKRMRRSATGRGADGRVHMIDGVIERIR